MLFLWLSTKSAAVSFLCWTTPFLCISLKQLWTKWHVSLKLTLFFLTLIFLDSTETWRKKEKNGNNLRVCSEVTLQLKWVWHLDPVWFLSVPICKPIQNHHNKLQQLEQIPIFTLFCIYYRNGCPAPLRKKNTHTLTLTHKRLYKRKQNLI